MDQKSLEYAIERGLKELLSALKIIVIVKTKNQTVFDSMILEPEPFGKPGYTQSKIVTTPTQPQLKSWV